MVAIVTADKDASIRHSELPVYILGIEIGQICHAVTAVGGVVLIVQVGLIQHLTVHRDGVGIVVDVNCLSAGSDDALDQRFVVKSSVLAQNDHIALSRRVGDAAHQHQVAVVERGVHGGTVHADHAAEEGEHPHDNDQYHHQQLEPFKQALTPVLLGLRLAGFL